MPRLLKENVLKNIYQINVSEVCLKFDLFMNKIKLSDHTIFILLIGKVWVLHEKWPR